MADLATPQRRKTRAVPCVTAAVAAGLLTAGMPIHKALAAGDCIEEPNRQPAPGGHWYYRTDRTNNRKCWFLAEPEPSMSQVQAPKALPSTEATLLQESTQSAAGHADAPPAPPLNRTEPPFEE
jgi:hypothetical protein